MILCRTLSRQCGCNLERWEYFLPINYLLSLQDLEQEWDGERKEGEMMSKEKKEEMPKEGEDICNRALLLVSI